MITIDKETVLQLLKFLSHQYVDYNDYPKLHLLIKELNKVAYEES